MSSCSSKLIQLAELVLENTKTVDSYFNDHGLPEPSFAVDGPADFGISADAAHIDAARVKVMEAAMELSDLLQGPMAFLRPIDSGISLHAISKWDIANKIPVGGELSFSELAQKCNIQEPDMRRIIRYAIVHNRLFCEPRPGFVAHSLASRMLVEKPLLRDGFWLLAENYFTSAPYVVEALGKWHDDEPNHTAFNLSQGTEKNSYEFMAERPELARRFALAMTSFAAFSNRPTTAPRMKMLQSYDWAGLGSSLVVDVGGSRGADAINFAQLNPNLHFIVQDLPKMIEGAEASLPQGLGDRISFMPYSFFTPQPVTVDIYLIKQCFHNWPDHYCVRILQNQVPALRAGARLIVVDSVVPPPGRMSLLDEMNVRAFDIMMLANSSRGREREEHDWLNIFKQADKRFKVESMETLHTTGDFGPSTGIIELTWQN